MPHQVKIVPAQPVRSPLEQALAAALAATTSHATAAAAVASPPTVTTGAPAAPHFFLGPHGSSSAESQNRLAGAAAVRLECNMLDTSALL